MPQGDLSPPEDEQNDRPEVPPRSLPKRRVPKSSRDQGATSDGRIHDGLPQRQLALELRYYIDLAMRPQGFQHAYRQMVADGIAANPHGSRSRHVIHNLGKQRMGWLKKEGLIE